jgi:hypothetical protein
MSAAWGVLLALLLSSPAALVLASALMTPSSPSPLVRLRETQRRLQLQLVVTAP